MRIRSSIILGLLFLLAEPCLASHSNKITADLLELAPSEVAPVLIVLEEQADLSAAASLATKSLKGRFVFEALSETSRRTQLPLLSVLQDSGVEHKAFFVSNLIWARATPAILERLAAMPEVKRIVSSPQGSIERPLERGETESSQSKAGIEWNLEMVRAPDVWAEGFTGQGVVVGGVDTGVFWQHAALIRQYRGYDGAVANHDYNWYDAIHIPTGGCDGDSPVPCDNDGHGTHTVGTIVGDDGLANQIGMAPDAKWIACRCWEPVARTDIAYVIECMQWMLAPTDLEGNNPNPDLAPHAINNSWFCEPVEGCTDPNAILPVVQNLRAAGIVVVSAAGNSGPGESTIEFPPAIYAESFTVGSVQASERISTFSSRGPVIADGSGRLKPDVVAPGENIRSSVYGSLYTAWDGTSMATPHVVGLVALLISAEPALAGKVSLIENIIKRTTYGSGTPSNNYGYGRIDAWRALQDAQYTVSNGPVGDEPPPESSQPGVAARLSQNSPNPFNPLTRLEFELPHPDRIKVTIYDAQGRRVRVLIDGRHFAAGAHGLEWDGTDARGAPAVSGVYFYRLEGTSFVRTRKMALIR